MISGRRVGVSLLARRDGEPIGCGALRTLESGVGEIKRMWIAPSARGIGLGRRLLAELEAEAVRHGFHTVRLDTNATLDEALNSVPIQRLSGNPALQREPVRAALVRKSAAGAQVIRLSRHSRESGNPATSLFTGLNASKGTGFPLSRE